VNLPLKQVNVCLMFTLMYPAIHHTQSVSVIVKMIKIV